MDDVRPWLSRFSRLNNAALEARAAARASTSSEDAVLGALLLFGPVLTPTVLKTLVIQSPGGLTKTLRRLERAGHLRRRTDPADRRALLVEMTPKGRRAAEHVVDSIDAYYDELLVDLDADELHQLGVLVCKVLDRLEAVTDMPSGVRTASELGGARRPTTTPPSGRVAGSRRR